MRRDSGDDNVGDGDGEDGVLGDHIIQYAPHQLPPAETRNNLGSNEVSLSNLITVLSQHCEMGGSSGGSSYLG